MEGLSSRPVGECGSARSGRREKSCTDLLHDPAGVLGDRRRWPDHLCYEEFLTASTRLWSGSDKYKGNERRNDLTDAEARSQVNSHVGGLLHQEPTLLDLFFSAVPNGGGYARKERHRFNVRVHSPANLRQVLHYEVSQTG
jgi:hypothetical protein